MGIWNPTVFLYQNNAADGDCTLWQNVGNFDNDWQDTQYWWVTRTGTYRNIPWNNACAIRLLITKCNALQAEIDAMAGAEVTMDSILEAMYESDKLRWFHFINYIDAMRAGIWNVEIYETHLAEWYRHFSI